MLKFNRTIILIIIIAVLIYTGCSMGFEPEETKNVNLSIAVPSVSPALTAILSTAYGRSASRAYLSATHIEVDLKNSGGTIISTVSNDVNFFSAFNVLTAGLAAAPGNDYSVDVRIYNYSNSTENPVVTGSSALFNVSAGTTTDVSVTCNPAVPVLLAENTETEEIDLSLTTFNLDDMSFIFGEEIWFEVNATSLAYNQLTFELIPTDPVKTGALALVFPKDVVVPNDRTPMVGGLEGMLREPGSPIQTTLDVSEYGEKFNLGIMNFNWYMSGTLVSQGGPFKLKWYEAEEVLTLSDDIIFNNVSEGDILDNSFTVSLDPVKYFTGYYFSINSPEGHDILTLESNGTACEHKINYEDAWDPSTETTIYVHFDSAPAGDPGSSATYIIELETNYWAIQYVTVTLNYAD